MNKITKKYKIEGLFWYIMDNKDFRSDYKFNDKYDTTTKGQKAFLKDIGYNNIIKLIKDITADENISIKVLEKKYNKSDHDRYITVEIDYTNYNIYMNSYKWIKELEYKINDILYTNSLYPLLEIY